MSVCPWYRDGFCTSPLHEVPTQDVVNKIQCLGGREVYTQCKYYREPTQVREGGYDEFGKPFLMVHGLDRAPEIACEYVRVFKHEQGKYLAGCVVLGRFLGIHEVDTCGRFWRQCPFRRIGLNLGIQLQP